MDSDTRDKILDILAEENAGMKVGQIREKLGDKGIEASKRTVQNALKELNDENRVTRRRVSEGTPGRPPFNYFITKTGDLDHKGEDEEEVEETYIQVGDESVPVKYRGDIPPIDRDMTDDYDLLEDLAVKHIENSEDVRDIKDAAEELREEDPRELILDFLKWVLSEINSKGLEVWRLNQSGNFREFSRRRDDLRGFIRWAQNYFNKKLFLGFHGSPGEEPDTNVVYIPDASEFYGPEKQKEDLPQAKCNEELVMENLKDRIFGDRVINIIESSDTEDVSIAGTDASLAEVEINGNSSQMRKTKLWVFTGAAALDRPESMYTDFDFDPEEVREYRDRKAFREGLLISSDLYPELDESHIEHAKYAAMDLRQYNENIRIVRDNADWRPVGNTESDKANVSGPDLIFSDGRLLPLVHQISDYESQNIYGDLVRNEVKRFAEMIDITSDQGMNSLYNTIFSGVVKNPGVKLISPLIYWYILKDEDDLTLEDIWRPKLDDTIVSHLLFSGLSEKISLEDDKIYSTFRVYRRFYEMSLDQEVDIPVVDEEGKMIDTDSVESWLDYFEDRIADRKERGYKVLDKEEYKPFAYSCATAGTLMGFAAPQSMYDVEISLDKLHVLLPRIEVAITDPHKEQDKMDFAVSCYCRKQELDEAHADEGFSDINDVPRVVPPVIKQSDEAAKTLRTNIESEIRRKLQEMIRKVQKER